MHYLGKIVIKNIQTKHQNNKDLGNKVFFCLFLSFTRHTESVAKQMETANWEMEMKNQSIFSNENRI